ncbi:LysR family transcriptional regulator [Burkholderia sp. WAC0059]|uniref:LysR substrate-binding domain-containing protein n=1 Tax=Burkholderia sp. WAC0059 TaxID=2066022 RepID=UPI000C7EB785|nr:LysR substrate-binding domain-containing protein [Burkholderia sp. WAC0059]PLZ01269.1 LysR family transcriptional regulator [Burkholderia sp. WAC0059]
MNPPPSPPLKALELRQLRYFSALARELHFGRAAEAVHVTQPALSQQIARLEELVGTPLFVRESRGVTLTPAGAALRDGIDPVFAQLNLALRAARDAGERRAYTLSIGLVEYTNLPFVPPALIRLQALYPDVNIVRHEMNAKRQLTALAADEIDVGFGVPVEQPGRRGRIGSGRLLDSGWCLLMRRDHRFAQRARLRIDELEGERLIVPARSVNEPLYDSVLSRFAGAGVKPNLVYETTQSQVGIALVDQGLGSLLGAAYVFASVPASLVYCPVDGFDPLVVQVFFREDERNPLVLDFIELAVEEARRAQTNGLAPAGDGAAD